jgi:CubicO group peptidase (beta-lactamase class C family)
VCGLNDVLDRDRIMRGWKHTSEMAGYVITLSTGGSTVFPLASQAKVVGALSADMIVAKMIVE